MIGYGIGYIGQGSSYNFMSAYFVLFLTNCVGLNAAVASGISSAALLVEVVMGMIVGNLSDNCTSKMGRRRPFMVMAACGVPPVLILITTAIKASPAVTIIYYLVLAILFRVFFTCFEIPNNAFGAEIASGYDERTKLRTVTRAISIIGNAIGYIAPLILFEIFKENDVLGWRMSGLVMAITSGGCWLIAVYMTRGKSIILDKSQIEKKKNLLKSIVLNYIELCKLKAMRILIIYKAGFACAFALYNVGTLYYLQNCLGLGNKYSSYMYAFQITIFALMTPVINKMALKMGKARQQMVSMLAGGIVGVLIFLIAPNNVIGGVIYIGLFSVVQTSFWQMSSSIFYDVVEVDEYVNNQRREGDIMSLVSVLGTLITAIMVQAFGITLDMAGFDASLEVQSNAVITVLDCMYILVPSICFLTAALALKVFPINKKSFAALQNVLKLRREGKDYSMYLKDIEKVIK